MTFIIENKKRYIIRFSNPSVLHFIPKLETSFSEHGIFTTINRRYEKYYSIQQDLRLLLLVKLLYPVRISKLIEVPEFDADIIVL